MSTKILYKGEKELLWQTKQAAQELDYDYFWTNNGQIYIREDEESNKIHVKSEIDLDNL